MDTASGGCFWSGTCLLDSSLLYLIWENLQGQLAYYKKYLVVHAKVYWRLRVILMIQSAYKLAPLIINITRAIKIQVTCNAHDIDACRSVRLLRFAWMMISGSRRNSPVQYLI